MAPFCSVLVNDISEMGKNFRDVLELTLSLCQFKRCFIEFDALNLDAVI